MTTLVSLVVRVRPEQREQLMALEACTRVRKSHYLRDAVDILLKRPILRLKISDKSWRPDDTVSMHFLVEEQHREMVNALAKSSRIPLAVMFREAVDVVLKENVSEETV